MVVILQMQRWCSRLNALPLLPYTFLNNICEAKKDHLTFTVMPITFKACFTRALVWTVGSLTNSVNVTAITSLCTWIWNPQGFYRLGSPTQKSGIIRHPRVFREDGVHKHTSATTDSTYELWNATFSHNRIDLIFWNNLHCTRVYEEYAHYIPSTHFLMHRCTCRGGGWGEASSEKINLSALKKKSVK